MEAQAFEGQAKSHDWASATLAKANLLRLRGEFGEAESLCLHVLDAFPADPGALKLMGDVRTAQGRHDDAERLYGASGHVSQVARPVGFKGPSWTRVAIAVVAFFAFIGFVASVVWIASAARSSSEPFTIHIRAPKDAAPVKEPPPAEPVVKSDPTPVADAALANEIERRSNATAHSFVLTAQHDPRSATAIVTITVAGSLDVRRAAATALFHALESDASLVSATARVIQDGRIVFVCDMTRSRIEDLRKTYPRLNVDQWLLGLSAEWPSNGRAQP